MDKTSVRTVQTADMPIEAMKECVERNKERVREVEFFKYTNRVEVEHDPWSLHEVQR